MNRLIIFVLLGLMHLPFSGAFSQERTAYNSVYLELAGNGIIYSMNYDRMFLESFSGRIGIMFLSATSESGGGNVSITFLPIMANYLIGSANHKFEVGVGPLIVIASATFTETGSFSGTAVGGTATAGYRYQPTDGGFNFRAGFTPIFGAGGFLPWAGVSFGYGF